MAFCFNVIMMLFMGSCMMYGSEKSLKEKKTPLKTPKNSPRSMAMVSQNMPLYQALSFPSFPSFSDSESNPPVAASSFKNLLKVIVTNNMDIGIKFTLINNVKMSILHEVMPQEYENTIISVQRNLPWQPLMPNTTLVGSLPEYEKLFGSPSIDSVSYIYEKSFLHIRAIDDEANPEKFPDRKIALRKPIENGANYTISANTEKQKFIVVRKVT